MDADVFVKTNLLFPGSRALIGLKQGLGLAAGMLMTGCVQDLPCGSPQDYGAYAGVRACGLGCGCRRDLAAKDSENRLVIVLLAMPGSTKHTLQANP